MYIFATYKDNTKSEPMAIQFDTIWMESVDSTNTEIVRRYDSLDNLSVIAAVNQTAGRGQRGNVWTVEPGANLTFSILLRFGESCLAPLKASSQFTISEAVTLALAEYLEGEGINAKIKWPNDIYVRDRKLVGILIENSLKGDEVGRSIVGIGINCNQREFPPQLMNPTSMSLLTGKRYDTKAALEDFLAVLGKYLGIMETSEGRSQMHQLYLTKMYRLGELHEYTDCLTGEVFNGTIKGISESALLQVEMPDGSIKEFAFKEISYIL